MEDLTDNKYRIIVARTLRLREGALKLGLVIAHLVFIGVHHWLLKLLPIS